MSEERTVSVFNKDFFLIFTPSIEKKKKIPEVINSYFLIIFFFHEQNSLLLLLSVKTYFSTIKHTFSKTELFS